MRANHFINLTKPRSVHRDRMEAPRSTQTFNFEEELCVKISDLNYKQIKNYNNLDAMPYAFEEDIDVLQWACAVLSQSAMGQALLTEAEHTGWSLVSGDLEHDGFCVNAKSKVIELDFYNMDARSLGKSGHYRSNIVCVLAKALRDIWLEERWGAFEENYKPEAVLLLERARAADSDAVSILIAWELRGMGYDDVWRHLLAGDDGDMALVFTNVLNRYPSAQFNGMALAHVFRQWYADVNRIDAQDHMTLQQMDNILEENDVKFGYKKVTNQEFELLSILPDGCMYLKKLGDTIENDPFFNGLNDVVNQSHLSQILYDNKVTYACGIPFRDAKLARKFL